MKNFYITKAVGRSSFKVLLPLKTTKKKKKPFHKNFILLTCVLFLRSFIQFLDIETQLLEYEHEFYIFSYEEIKIELKIL